MTRCLILCLLLCLGQLTWVSCAAPQRLSQQNQEVRDFNLALQAVEEILTTEGYPLRDERTNPMKFSSGWRTDGETLRSVSVIVQDHSIGPAIKMRVNIAVPVDNANVDKSLQFEHQDRRWRLDRDQKDASLAERQRLGTMILDRWKALRRQAINDAER